LASGVDNADVHRLDVQIDAVIVTMLTVVESHRLSFCATRAVVVDLIRIGGQVD
jgi:hypothetical protein